MVGHDHALDIDAARSFLLPLLHRTPLVRSATLSGMVGRDVYLKLELFQKTGSYKPRGMAWAIENLEPEQRARGVLTFSAGNAAQGLAWAASRLGVFSHVVMAATANPSKVEATRDYGAEVILHGTPQEAAAFCAALAEERGLTFISSYDDATLMTGHASLGIEIIEDLPDVTDIFVGVGGGGMAGGLVRAVESMRHSAALYGIEPEGAAAMSRSMAEGRALRLDKVTTIADGLAAPGAGAHCLELVRRRFRSVTTVSDDQILDAMRLVMRRCKVMAEPAGAASVAGLLLHANSDSLGQKVVCVISGGNIDLAQLRTWL